VNGHQTSAADWCDVCGIRIAAPPAAYGSRPVSAASSSSASPVSTPPASPSPAPASPAAGAAEPDELCPACGTPREGGALFCEECRPDFRGAGAAPAPPVAPAFPPYLRYDSQPSRPSQVHRAAEPLPSESVTVSAGSGDFLLDPPSRPAVPRQGGASNGTEATGGAVAASGAGEQATTWVAVVTADRAYFAAMMARSGPDAQGLYFPAYSPERALPLDGEQVTIGRRRHSTGQAPDIDLSRAPEDPGVSHDHAMLVRQPDGGWAVVDKESTNGTTVNLAEDAIPPYTPVPLSEGDRVHVGAWTTITLHRA
jgi:hypothetical protein